LKARRGAIERLFEILSIVRHGASKTQVVYRANLNFQSAEKDLVYLRSRGLLDRSMTKGGLGRYFLTGRGETLLGLLTQVATSVPEVLSPPPELKSSQHQLLAGLQRSDERRVAFELASIQEPGV